MVIRNCHNHEWIISCGNLRSAMAWLSGKESTCQCRRCGFDPWLGKIPWRRTWQSTPVFLLGKSHDMAAWQAIAHGIAKSWIWLRDWPTNSVTCIRQAAGHGNSIHSTCIYWRPTVCQALFQTLMLGHWAKMTKLCLHPASTLQHGAYILGLGRESDHIATYTSKTCSDFRVLSAGN